MKTNKQDAHAIQESKKQFHGVNFCGIILNKVYKCELEGPNYDALHKTIPHFHKFRGKGPLKTFLEQEKMLVTSSFYS